MGIDIIAASMIIGPAIGKTMLAAVRPHQLPLLYSQHLFKQWLINKLAGEETQKET
jgi:hypothetical protein